MENQIEVEYIGKIDQTDFSRLKQKFLSEGKFKKDKKRISFMYFRGGIPKEISEISNEQTDLRIRFTNKQPELIVKTGSFTGTHARKEISINFLLGDFQKYVDLLSSLDWKIGVIYATETNVYEFKGIEFSLVNIKDYGFNFEAEILTSQSGEKEAKKKIELVLKELGLNPFDKKGLDNQCNTINNRTELQFNFSKQKTEDFIKRFREFF
jgi:adenylate cyclase class IV